MISRYKIKIKVLIRALSINIHFIWKQTKNINLFDVYLIIIYCICLCIFLSYFYNKNEESSTQKIALKTLLEDSFLGVKYEDIVTQFCKIKWFDFKFLNCHVFQWYKKKVHIKDVEEKIYIKNKHIQKKKQNYVLTMSYSNRLMCRDQSSNML